MLNVTGPVFDSLTALLEWQLCNGSEPIYLSLLQFVFKKGSMLNRNMNKYKIILEAERKMNCCMKYITLGPGSSETYGYKR